MFRLLARPLVLSVKPRIFPVVFRGLASRSIAHLIYRKPQILTSSVSPLITQATRSYATRVTKKTNILHIRRRKINVHKYKKRRRKLRKSARYSMAGRRKTMSRARAEEAEIRDLLKYFGVLKE